MSLFSRNSEEYLYWSFHFKPFSDPRNPHASYSKYVPSQSKMYPSIEHSRLLPLQISHVFRIFHSHLYLRLGYKLASSSSAFFLFLKLGSEFKPIQRDILRASYFASDLHLLNCLTRPIRLLLKSIM